MKPMSKFWRETLRSVVVALVVGGVSVATVAAIYAGPRIATHWNAKGAR